MPVELCPCCGQPKPQEIEPSWDRAAWRLTTKYGSVVLGGAREVELFDLLWRKRGKFGLTAQRVLDALYAEHPDGGPNANAVPPMMNRLRCRVEPVGVWIAKALPGTGRGYTIEFDAPDSRGRTRTPPERDRSEYFRTRYRSKSVVAQSLQVGRS